MDDSEKEIIENLKNFNIKKLFMKETYVEIQIHDVFRQAFILEAKGNDKFTLIIQKVKGINEVPINILNFYSENDYIDDYKMREDLINIELSQIDPDDLLTYIKKN